MPPILQHPLANPRYTQQYAERPNVYGGRGHMGVDYGCATGTPILAVAAGVVDKAITGNTGYGTHIILWHSELRLYTLYGHLSQLNVKVGDAVAQKDTIGLSGNTGNSTGPHLHFEWRMAKERGVYDPVPGFANGMADPVSSWMGFMRNPFMPADPPPPNGSITVKVDRSNVRSGPGTNNSIVGVLAAGSEGIATARNEASTWVTVEVGDVKGWMAAYLLDIVGGVEALPVYGAPPVEPTDPTDPPPVFEGVQATVNTARVNVRSGPGTDNAIVGLVLLGTEGKAIGRNEEASWIAVEMPEVSGWIAEYLLDVEGDHGTLPVIPTEPNANNFERAMAFVERWEGGYVNHPSDPGGATNMGITIGTLTKWRKWKGLPAATVADVKALTRAEANAIYKAYYWEASGADEMDWPLCLAHFDLAVNGGVGRAAQALREAGPDFDAYMAWRIAWYKTLSGFPTFGAGWLNRCNDLIRLVKG